MNMFICTWNFIPCKFTLHCMFTVTVNAPKAQPKTKVLVIATMATMLQLLFFRIVT